MAQRFIEGIHNHEKFSKFSYNQYEKRSPVGQLQTLYNVEPARPFISVRLPEKSGIPERSSESGFAGLHSTGSLNTKSQRGKSAPIWIKVPNHNEMLESCALSEVPKPRRVVFSRPYTVAVNSSNQSKQHVGNKSSRKSAGRRAGSSQTKSTIYRFKPLNVERPNNKESIELCTALIKEQWDSRKRQYIKTGVYARGTPEAKEQDLLQWFTFEGESPGALSAFIRGSVDEEHHTSARFSIEANVGKEVAAKLVLGETVRIGSNGKLLKGSEVEKDEDDVFYDKCDQVLNMTSGAAQKHEPLYPPLCWKDLEKEAKVLTSRSKNGIITPKQLSKTEPVVYNRTPDVRPYVPPNSQSDMNRLNNLLSHKITSRSPEPEPNMTYEEILESCAPGTSRLEKTVPVYPGRQPMPTRENTDVDRQNSFVLNRLPKSAYHQPSTKLVNKSLSAQVRTPCIPDEVKSGIQRQVTMPAYKIVPGSVDKIAGRPKTSQDIFHERVSTPTRPPKYIPSYNSGGGTTPSISHSGVEGDKSYMQIIKPFNQFLKQETNIAYPAYRAEAERRSKLPNFHAEHMKRPNNTPANISSVALIGKAPHADDITKYSIKFQPESNSQISDSDISSLTEATKLDNLEMLDAENEHIVNRLAINIPAVDMISASSAAVNSIADFQEFDTTSVKVQEELKGEGTDMNNNNCEELGVAAHSDDGSGDGPRSIASFDDDDSVNFSISVDIERRLDIGHPAV